MSSSGGIGSDKKVYCKHLEEAVKRKSYAAQHLNRTCGNSEFYCCKRGRQDQTGCGFWHWVDDPKIPELKESVVQTPDLSVAQSFMPPRPSSGVSTARPIATPTRMSPNPFVTPNNPSPKTPGGRKRLEDIEAGLRQREWDHSPTRLHGLQTPSKEPGPSISSLAFNAQHAIPQPPSPVPTEVDCEEEPRPRKTYSFLGLDRTSPEPVASTIPQEAQPSTPKKPRLTRSTQGAAIQPTADGVLFSSGLPLTPPQTTHRITQYNEPSAVSAKIPSRKGKEREDALPARTQEQCWEPQDEDDLPLFTDASSISSASPTTAENVLDYADGVMARVKALSEYMESFDITQASKLLQTMERQKVQLECRDRSQKQRIAELVVEKDGLLAEVLRLKKALELIEAGRRFSSRSEEMWNGGD